jgi:hypothetical protein
MIAKLLQLLKPAPPPAPVERIKLNGWKFHAISVPFRNSYLTICWGFTMLRAVPWRPTGHLAFTLTSRPRMQRAYLRSAN